MHLVQILLPLRNNDGHAFAKKLFDDVRNDLAANFGGVTTYMRSPGHGLWEKDGELLDDDVVIFEVMVERLEREFWRLYRTQLQKTFQQELVTMRATDIDIL